MRQLWSQSTLGIMNTPEDIPKLVCNENVVVFSEFYCREFLWEFSGTDLVFNDAQPRRSLEHTASSEVLGTLHPIFSSVYHRQKLQYRYHLG